MTKDQLAQELEAEFAKGNLKPSQLKRSRSADSLPSKPTDLTHCETELANTKKQLATAQQQIASFQEQLKQTQQQLTETQQALDNSLEARLNNLKSFDPSQPTAHQQLQTELTQAKRKISLLESTLRLHRYNNSWIDSETLTLALSFLAAIAIFLLASPTKLTIKRNYD